MKRLFIKTQRVGSQKPLLEDDSGQVGGILLALTVSTALLLLAGYAIDVSNMTYKTVQLQRAVDAGAVAGVNTAISMISQGETLEKAKTQAYSDSSTLIRYNASRFSKYDAEITADAWSSSSGGLQFQIWASLQVDTLFMKMLGMPQMTVTATAKGQKNLSFIMLVLDRSGSMSDSTNCDQNGNNCKSTKIKDLRIAAKLFLDQFDLDTQHIGIVSFDNEVILDVGLNDRYSNTLTNPGPGSGAGKLLKDCTKQEYTAYVKKKVNDLVAGSTTNSSSAIAAARYAIESTVNAFTTDDAVKKIIIKVIIFESDGAPNTMQVRFVDTTPKATLSLNYPDTNQTKYFYIYNLYNLYGYNIASSTLADSPPAGDSTKKFFGSLDDGTEKWYYSETDAAKLKGSASDYLNGPLKYLDSKEVQWTGHSVGDATEPYDIAVIEADNAKKKDITIYAVGLGTSAAASSTDPYQDAKNSHSLKSNFMRQIANVSSPDIVYNSPWLGYESGLPTGTYVEAANSSDLSDAFLTIAKKIKLRLVS